MRVIVADHHAQSLLALKTMLQEQSGFDLIGEAQNADELLQMAASAAVDVVVVDRGLPGSSISDLLANLHSLEKRPFVIVMDSHPEYSRMALSAGADAFISKVNGPEWLLEYLHRYTGRDNTR
jgi:DNA-binding NarL/FixJ family response regulator